MKKRKKANKIKMKMTKKSNNKSRAKINLKMKIKSQILRLYKTTIKTSKESEKYVSSMKKSKNILARKVSFRSKEIRLILK